MKLEKAMEIAAKISDEIAPYCSRLQIAGSIRRQRAEVGDIDIVCLPANPAAKKGLRQRVIRTNPRIIADGSYTLEVELAGKVRLDIWMAETMNQRDFFSAAPHTNFGSLLLCRTGSIAHNVFLVGVAKHHGLRWNPHWGVYDNNGVCLASENEEDIFKALKLDFIKPEDRER